MDEFLFAKRSRLEFCVQRARACVALTSELPFEQDETRQDAAGLSVLRAIELAIGLADHVVHTRKLGATQTSSDSFETLARDGVISGDLARELQSLVAFKDLLIRHHSELDPKLLHTVIKSKLDHLIELVDAILDQTCTSI